ncbi:MAG TPA: aminotransferase, partial [candidate division Zixibacteria bacterium]|nr:aminotransferase [candidate division Zixibacteria bacterium]
INMAGGLPAPELFPIDAIKQACLRVLDKYGPDSLQYSLTTGVPILKQYIADRTSADGIEFSPDAIQITGGSQQGLDIVGRVFLEPGSVVLTEEPTYLGALQAFSFYQAQFVSVKTDENGIIPSDLEYKIKEFNPAFIYLVPNFQNPSGITMSAERRHAVVALAKKYDIPIVDDNPYGELRFYGNPVPSLKVMGGQHVIQLGTFSKIISPGLRIGWIAADKEFIRMCELMKQACDLHSNTFAQYVIYEFAKDGALEAHIEVIKKAYKIRRDLMIDTLAKELKNGTTWSEPEGGLFLWVKLPNGISASELLPKAISAGFAYVPGKHFYSQNPDDTTLRLNFCNATEKNIVEGVKRLAAVVKAAK